MPELKKTLQDKFDHLLDVAGGKLEPKEFEWLFEVFLMWCIIKTPDEIEKLVERLTVDVVKYLDKMGHPQLAPEKPENDKVS